MPMSICCSWKKSQAQPMRSRQTSKTIFLLLIWGQDCVYRLYYVHSLLSALPRPESGMHMPWEQFNNDILSISIFVHIKKNTTATLPVRFFLHCSFQSPKTLKKKQDFCWKGKPETDLEDYLNLNLVLISMWPVFSGAIWVFKVSYAEARQEIYQFMFYNSEILIFIRLFRHFFEIFLGQNCLMAEVV